MESDLDEELRYHLEKDAERNIAGGMEPEEARLAALRGLGGVDQFKEECRDARGVRFIEELLQDLRYAARILDRRRGFSLVVVLTLALGIGANTAAFSLIDSFLLRLLPVEDPEHLVFVRATRLDGETTGRFPYGVFERLRNENSTVSGIFAYDDTKVSATVDGHPEMLAGDFVSGSYFDVLGVGAALGRTFTEQDDKPGVQPTAVISYGFWERRLAKDPQILGKSVYVGGIGFTVIGVTPSGFFGRNLAGTSADIVLPMAMHGVLALRDHNTYGIMARLRQGVSPDQARADLDVIYHRSLTEESTQGEIARARGNIELSSGAKGESNWIFTIDASILAVLVAIVLLVASINVAGLLLARAAERQKEITIRLAMGAGRPRLVRQLLTESVLLALIGGAVGLLLTKIGGDLLVNVLSDVDRIPFELRTDSRVLLFTGTVSIFTGILFGLAPALVATRLNLASLLKGDDGAGKRPSLIGRRLSKSLIVPQVALSVALLMGAGLLIRSLRQLYNVDTGFERERVLTMWVFPALARYDHDRELILYSKLIDKINATPGVQSASLSRYSLTLNNPDPVGPRFFETMGIPVLDGREFSAADTAGSQAVAIISESLARKYFPNSSPVGCSIPAELRKERLGHLPTKSDLQIVGVVADVRHRLWRQRWDEDVYIPYVQAPASMLGQAKLMVRTSTRPEGVIGALRSQTLSVDKDLPLVDLKTQAEELGDRVGAWRSLAQLLSFWGGLALVLASIGLYGTMSYLVGRRTKELGIRMALGATRREILGMVMREAFIQVAIGVVFGILLALAGSRLIASLLFGVTVTDMPALVAAVLTMALFALVAAYLPARRATRIAPIEALRCE